MLASEVDIILVCHKIRKELNSHSDIVWLKACQDDNRRREDLPPEAELNSTETDDESAHIGSLVLVNEKVQWR